VLGQCGNVKEATPRAVRAVASAIAAAGLLLAASFGSLLDKDTNTGQMGFATAFGILFAGVVVSTLLGPAITTRRREGVVATPTRARRAVRRPRNRPSAREGGVGVPSTCGRPVPRRGGRLKFHLTKTRSSEMTLLQLQSGRACFWPQWSRSSPSVALPRPAHATTRHP